MQIRQFSQGRLREGEGEVVEERGAKLAFFSLSGAFPLLSVRYKVLD